MISINLDSTPVFVDSTKTAVVETVEQIIVPLPEAIISNDLNSIHENIGIDEEHGHPSQESNELITALSEVKDPEEVDLMLTVDTVLVDSMCDPLTIETQVIAGAGCAITNYKVRVQNNYSWYSSK